MKRHFVYTLAVLMIIILFGLPESSMARSRGGIAFLQIAAGVPATAGGCWVGAAYAGVFSENAPEKELALIISVGVAVPLLTSSAVVYTVGKLAGYHGSYPVTLLSGALWVTSGFVYAILRLRGTPFDDTWVSVLLWSILSVPIAETIGFHLSAGNSHTNVEAPKDDGQNAPLLNVDGRQLSLSMPSFNVQSRQLSHNYWETDYTIRLVQMRF